MVSAVPQILVISFSHIASDARVLKQINHLSELYTVVTCGHGSAPAGATKHYEIPYEEPRWRVLLRAALIRAHAYHLAYRVSQPVHRAKRALKRSRIKFDAVLANDLDTAGTALSVANADRIHLDLHEYWPGRDDQNPAWVRLRQPFMAWQLRHFARRVRSVTTVSDTIARRYLDEFGFRSEVVANASPFKDQQPSAIREPLRLVHSGATRPNRQIEVMMRAVAASRTGAILDLYLTGEGTHYYESLQQLATELGDRVQILPPVPQEQLVETLNRYDLGLHLLPPTNTNNALALPNKFFDFIQARIGIIIGPTASMAEIVEQYDLGVVTLDFSAESLTRVIEGLNIEQVRHYKQNTTLVANDLSAENQSRAWWAAISVILKEQVRPGANIL